MPSLPALSTVSNPLDPSFDALAVVAPAEAIREPSFLSGLFGEEVGSAIEAAVRVDSMLGRGGGRPVVLPVPGAPGGRVVLATTGNFADDTDDVRTLAETTSAATSRAADAGARRLVISVTAPPRPKLARALDVAALAALGSQWSPLEAREAGKAPRGLEAIGVVDLSPERAARAAAIEVGRALCRDIAGTEPERMVPLAVAALCEEAFAGTGVQVDVDREPRGYPLLMAVSRASLSVPRHRPCVVRLDYEPEGGFERTVVLVGKGVTYDTGGADLKTDGAMAGMSRDKGGAGAVAGLVRAAAALKIPNVRVIGLLGLVRNSVGEEAFVSDEIIRSRAGVRVRIGNTDAEGRLVLADLLAAAGELTASDPGAELISIATLTGHVYRAYGPYVGSIGNAVARDGGLLDALDAAGELWGEPMEQSRVRREDYALIAPRSSAEDVVSSNRLATVNTPRGHQFPFAFIEVASGLRRGPRPLVHLDISGAAYDPPDWQFGRPTGSPIATLAAFLSGD
ncbi:MAG: aminopeptidase [Polyangiaceae bacterium]|nr:aminopeptidase [Polyangiaceae bacterium]